jgi:hypothetical protein
MRLRMASSVFLSSCFLDVVLDVVASVEAILLVGPSLLFVVFTALKQCSFARDRPKELLLTAPSARAF